MTDKKGMFSSVGVWGGIGAGVSGIIAFLAAIAPLFGYSVAPEDQQTLVAALTGIGGAVSGLIAVYGRITATKVIK